MIKVMTVDELSILLKKQSQILREYENKVRIEREKYLEIKKELDSRNKWNKTIVVNRMLQQLQDNIKNISSNGFYILGSELSAIQNKYKRQPGRDYGHDEVMKKIYFNVGPIIASQIRKLDYLKYKFAKTTFTITIEFNQEKDTITSTINGNDLFKNQTGKKIILHEDSQILRKLIVTKIKKEYDSYEEIIPNMIEVVNFIKEDLSKILIGINLSTMGEE